MCEPPQLSSYWVFCLLVCRALLENGSQGLCFHHCIHTSILATVFPIPESGTVAGSAAVGVNIETMTGIEGNVSPPLATNLAPHKSACGETGKVASLFFFYPQIPWASALLSCFLVSVIPRTQLSFVPFIP